MDAFTIGAGMTEWQARLGQLSKEFRDFAAQGLNDMAFAYRETAPQVLAEKRKIRDPRFVQSRFRVEKVAQSRIAEMKAVAGSTFSDRFSGWVEDYGEKPANGNKRAERGIGKPGRGGDMANKASRASRLAANLPSPKDFPGKSWAQRIQAEIASIAKDPGKAPGGAFILYGGGKWAAGVYRIDARAARFVKASARKKSRGGLASAVLRYAPVKMVQKFGIRDKHGRYDWSGETVKKLAAMQDAIWEKAKSKTIKE